jgi:hypothetical protein
VRARIEGDLVVFGQLLGDVHAHVVEIAERRHGAELTIREQAFELVLRGQHHFVCTERALEMIEVHATRCGQDGHRIQAVDLDDDGLGEILTRDARQFCDPLRGVGW